MKALKTILATAVIVLAFTTVAVAGVRHVGSWNDATVSAAGPAAPHIHQGAGVTLSDGQFAQLLHSLNGRPARLHATQADRDMSRDRARDRSHVRQEASDSAMHGQAQQRTQTHDGGGTHERGTGGGSTHHGGTHLGGDTHHDGGMHDGGTHHGGTHDGGTHDGGTCGD
jgi:hypothetical protein